jgi:hypothetical protein
MGENRVRVLLQESLAVAVKTKARSLGRASHGLAGALQATTLRFRDDWLRGALPRKHG